MASIIATSIDLTKIDKSKIIEGKKGKYLPITITLNDEPGLYGSGSVIIEQSKEERDVKAPKVYLGNPKVVWTNGNNVDVFDKQQGQQRSSGASHVPADGVFIDNSSPKQEDPLPF